jgi:release factor glutamine methyltransferase
MNHIIADNSVRSLKKYLTEKLSSLYDEREAGNIVTSLFQEYLGWSKADIILNQDKRVSESELLKFHFALKRLVAGEPLQYITGHQMFCGNDFLVDPAVLIPRPETEELVMKICEEEKRTAPAVLDIGTGSGCIAISLKLKKTIWRVTGVDISEDALSVAKKNATRLQADVVFHPLNILVEEPEGQFDLIVSNPPYIPEKEKGEMSVQVTAHEPATALFTPDDDELLFYRRIIELANKKLTPGGSLWFEIHEGKKADLTQLLESTVRANYHFYTDLQGKDRILHVRFI